MIFQTGGAGSYFDQMSAVLDRAEVDYLKWDFNRSICDVYSAALSADRQGEVLHRYVLGLYEFLERLGNDIRIC